MFYRYKPAAEYLIKAKQWNDSHSVIMEHIAAQAIIDGKFIIALHLIVFILFLLGV